MLRNWFCKAVLWILFYFLVALMLSQRKKVTISLQWIWVECSIWDCKSSFCGGCVAQTFLGRHLILRTMSTLPATRLSVSCASAWISDWREHLCLLFAINSIISVILGSQFHKVQFFKRANMRLWVVTGSWTMRDCNC